MTQKQVLVCQNTVCRRQGSKSVLGAFFSGVTTDVSIVKSGCLGQCGNGPTVLLLPEKVCYTWVQPNQVPMIIQKHRSELKPVKEK